MTYELFSRLLIEAKEAPNLDNYILERGWQDWMDEYSSPNSADANRITNILKHVYKIGDMSIAELVNAFRAATKDTVSSAAVPYRTLRSWISGEREPAPYLLVLMSYVVFNADE